ncbi:hypothetical protein E2C01_050598 [Portunus trituberculatus]|uniref:Uncharacterized protein n=1 Tax=Portunus trituberculatus TaxID=210409 RepID=A0A5B7GGY1_PORTR|nr:hypothetical protein [Portunus trituberculatus]
MDRRVLPSQPLASASQVRGKAEEHELRHRCSQGPVRRRGCRVGWRRSTRCGERFPPSVFLVFRRASRRSPAPPYAGNIPTEEGEQLAPARVHAAATLYRRAGFAAAHRLINTTSKER